MATYTIIGGDGKEYGPITADDIRRWVAEGRLNAQSLAKAESDAEFRPLAQFPDLADMFQPATPGPIAPLSGPAAMGGDYELDIGDCVSRGWTLYKNNFGALFVSALVAFVIQFAFSGCISLFLTIIGVQNELTSSNVGRLILGFIYPTVGSLVAGPVLGGLFLIYLHNIRGESAGVGNLFTGFQKSYGQLVLGSLVTGLINVICLAPYTYAVGQKAAPVYLQLQHMQNQQPDLTQLENLFSQLMAAYAGAMPVLLVCMVPLTYLAVCFQFTLPLIIDRQLSFGAAMKLSLKRVNQHWWLVFGLTVIVGLISLAGVLGCCIGIVFTAPLGFAMAMYGYETIFSGRKS